jgi:high-affinity iron transporter
MTGRWRMRLGIWVLAVGLAVLGGALAPGRAVAADDDAALAAGLLALNDFAAASQAALAQGDVAGARAAYQAFDAGWEDLEDGVRARSRDAYRAIEQAMDDAQFSLRASDPDTSAAQAALATLRERVLAFAATLGAAPAPATGLADADAAAARVALRPWAARVDEAVARLAAGDVTGAEAAFEAFRQAWPSIEDGIRPVSRAHYREIERAMGEARVAFGSRPVDIAAAAAALQRLQAANAAFLAGEPVPGGDVAAAAPVEGASTPATLIALLDRALAANDLPTAQATVRQFQEVWLDVEGMVLARSPAVYSSIENQMAEATALLNRGDAAGAQRVLGHMRAALVPIVEAGSQYGVGDAAIILFREGLEALLVVAALLAFLQRAGNADKRGWIWGGAAAGVGASLAVAVVAQLILARAAANVGREVIEGFTGLVAAGMLLYVGHWLHSKASLGAWQHYIHERGRAALRRNSLFGLALIAFLAVFREGAETVLFYIGIASSITLSDLLLGLGLGAAALALLAVLMLVVGVRVPVRPFFLGATVLIYYLCLKFAGAGVHALQVAGVVHTTPAPSLPAWDFIGMFPTWETALVQLVVLAVILGSTFLPRLAQQRVQPAA